MKVPIRWDGSFKFPMTIQPWHIVELGVNQLLQPESITHQTEYGGIAIMRISILKWLAWHLPYRISWRWR